MLSALLNSIQSTLGSRGFLVSAVFPVTLFAMVNGLLGTLVWPRISGSLDRLDTVDKTLAGAAGLGAVLIASYLISALTSAILETFEGRHWPVTWFRRPLYRLQLARLRELGSRYNACVRGLDGVATGLEDDPTATPAILSWVTKLTNARNAGRVTHPKVCSYQATPMELSSVRRRRETGMEIPATMFKAAVDKFLPVLQANDADGALTATTEQRALDRDFDYLVEAMYFSRDQYQAERIRLYNLRKFHFPVDAESTKEESTITLAPTALGNVARTMRSYAQNYYGFDLDVLWTRLQNAMRSSEPYFTSLQDAKVQLDFFAACAWLTWVSTVAWLAIQLVVLHSGRGFLLAGIGGPIVAHTFYLLACRAYGVFADVMRTGVDLFRLKVLSDLHLPLPPGLEEERVGWLKLANAMGYLNMQGSDGSSASFNYKHGA